MIPSSFYPIFDSARWLERMLPRGVRFAQLRIKDLAGEALEREIVVASQLAETYGCELVINDHWQLAIDLDCRYIHLGQEDLDDADVVAIRQAGLQLGISTHSHDELERALTLDPDYVALGPVYPTILKEMAWPAQGLERVSEWRHLVGDIPLVAIGGINTERAPGLFEAGADCVSLVTDITLNDDPEGRVDEWLELTAQWPAGRPHFPD